MKFSSFYELVLENEDNVKYVVFLEDDPGRTALFRAYMNKFIPDQRYMIFDKMGPMEDFIEKHYNNIVMYSLDYNVYDRTSEPIAVLLAMQYNNKGDNVIIHSDDDWGATSLQKYLPQAKRIEAPNNIIEISKRLS